MTLVTEFPKVTEVVVSGVPLPGSTVMSSDSVVTLYAGLVPSAVMVSASPLTTSGRECQGDAGPGRNGGAHGVGSGRAARRRVGHACNRPPRCKS